MLTSLANEDTSRISLWRRVREYAVPPAMIETATARRVVGDWGGACAAAGFDVDIGMRALTRTHGRELAAAVRDDLRYLVPDLLRWHLPRIAPDGMLRPGLTMALARYPTDESRCRGSGSVLLVARTAPAWADAGQRISLALWDESLPGAGAALHPHRRPDRRFRLDLHRHLWDARRSDELRMRSGAVGSGDRSVLDPELLELMPQGFAVDRWAAEAEMLLRAAGRHAGPVLVRLGARRRVVVEFASNDPVVLRITRRYPRGSESALPVLPDAATWRPPDLDLLRAGAITADRLHPLVAAALVPDHVPSERFSEAGRSDQPGLVECRGERHRIGLRDGVLTALDHDPVEVRREELLVALTGTPLPCLQAIDRAHRHPDCLAGVRERLSHGDIAGALAVVEGLLGPGAQLRDGALRDELEAAARRRVTYGMFRAGLSFCDPPAEQCRRSPYDRTNPRHAIHR
ncbi:hypothetical protein [Nocardia sp. NBC_00511]|uniref:hypothetical protein n=1 Tax=Nocardia sp. NBC_00511 TaxID=2903591 RepID=UPI0030E0E309